MGNPGHADGTVEDVPISPDQESALAVIMQGQAGVASARQLSTIGVSLHTVRAEIGARRWTRLHAGIYATFTGPQPDLARVWAAVLAAGEDAVASHQTAEWLWGLRADLPACLSVPVPHGQRLCSRPGVLIRQRRFLADRRHPARTPPLTTVEDTLLDLAEEARTERQVIDLLPRGCQQRRTTPSRSQPRQPPGLDCAGGSWFGPS